MSQNSGQGKPMKNSKNIHTISSTLKTVASENLVTEAELQNLDDKPLEELLNEQKQENAQEKDQFTQQHNG